MKWDYRANRRDLPGVPNKAFGLRSRWFFNGVECEPFDSYDRRIRCNINGYSYSKFFKPSRTISHVQRQVDECTPLGEIVNKGTKAKPEMSRIKSSIGNSEEDHSQIQGDAT
jgi:hypothetical protein